MRRFIEIMMWRKCIGSYWNILSRRVISFYLYFEKIIFWFLCEVDYGGSCGEGKFGDELEDCYRNL